MFSKSRAVATIDHNGTPSNHRAANLPTVADERKLPGPVVGAVRQLLLCYQTGGAANERDYDVVVSVYMEIVARFPPLVAEMAVKRLLVKNPRNPFRPSPQDVHDAMAKMMKSWEESVFSYLTTDSWIDWTRDETIFMKEIGAPPLHPGCLIPDDIQRSFIKCFIDNGICHSRLLNGIDFDTRDQVDWPKLTDEVFDRWPVDLLKASGKHDEIIAARAARKANIAEARAEREKEQARQEAHCAAVRKANEELEARQAAAEVERQQKRNEEDRKLAEIEKHVDVAAAITRMDEARKARAPKKLETAYRDYVEALQEQGIPGGPARRPDRSPRLDPPRRESALPFSAGEYAQQLVDEIS